MTVKIKNLNDTYGNCNRCGAYGVHRQHHTCPPVWRVRVESEGPDEFSDVFAADAEQAAEKFCERFDSDLDYSIIRAGQAVLIVERDGAKVRVHVEAESLPHYSARVMDEDDV